MPRPVKLSVVRSERNAEAAKGLRGEMFRGIREAISEMGDDISGYAFVAWDKHGANASTMKSGGPIQSRLTPTFVGDALTQHVTCDLVRR
jgi:hypothetical protein